MHIQFYETRRSFSRNAIEAPLTALLKQVRAEPADAGHKVGEIDFPFLLERFFR